MRILYLKIAYYINHGFKKRTIKKVFLISFYVLLAITATLLLFFYEVNNEKIRINNILKQEEKNIEASFLDKLDHTEFVIKEMIGHILQNPHDKKYIYGVMETYKTKPDFIESFSWTIFSWTDPKNQIIVDAVYGIIDKPLDLSMRDYIHLTQNDTGKFYLGEPVFGSTSKKWMIPGGIGAELPNGKYLGSMTIGFEIEVLAKLLHNVVKNKNVSFKLIDLTNLPILYISNNYYDNCKKEVCNLDEDTTKILNNLKFSQNESISDLKVIGENSKAILAKKLQKYPYILLLEYDKNAFKKELIKNYIAKIKILTIFTIFLLSLILSYKIVFV